MLSHALLSHCMSLYSAQFLSSSASRILLWTCRSVWAFPYSACNSPCLTWPQTASRNLPPTINYIMVFVSMTWVMRVTGGHGRLQNLLCFLCLRSQPSHQTIQTLPSHKKGNNFTIRTEFYNCVFFISHHSTSSTVYTMQHTCTIHIWSSLLGA